MWQYRHTSSLMHSAYADRPYYAVEYSDDLYHYGVLGMKWGIRKERSSSGTGRGRGRKKLTAKQKKLIKNIAIGTTIAGGAALAGGALALQSHNQLSRVGGIKGLRAAKAHFRTTTGHRVSANTIGREARTIRNNPEMVGFRPGFSKANTWQRQAQQAQARQAARFERGWAKASKNSAEAQAQREANRILNSKAYKQANTTSQGYNLNLSPGGFRDTTNRVNRNLAITNKQRKVRAIRR